MKHKKKNILRIGTLISIVMFLLFPLMSTPVAAAHNVYLGSVTTDVFPSGSAAGGTVASVSGSIVDVSPFNANYDVDYFYTDSVGAPGSDHWTKVNVNWVPPSGPPGSITFTHGPITVISTTNSGTWQTPSITGYGGKGTVFTVTFEVHCEDKTNPDNGASWYSSTIVYTII